MEQTINLEATANGKVMNITLNRPEKLNALGPTEITLLGEHLTRIASDDDVRVVILRGAGRAFCSGADLGSTDVPLETVADWRKELTAEASLLMQLWSLPQPVIAAVHGFCLGLGCDLMLACDFAVAAANTKVGEPEIKHAAASTFLVMPYIAGMRATKRMLLTGDIVDADSAKEMGLVTKVVPTEDLDEEVEILADTLMRIPSQALRMNKIGLNKVYEAMGMRLSVDFNVELMAQILVSDSAKTFDGLIKEKGLREALRLREEGLEI